MDHLKEKSLVEGKDDDLHYNVRSHIVFSPKEHQ